MEVRLQPLRIPTGWHVAFNDLHEVDPFSEWISAEERRWFFKEDLLQLKQDLFNRLLDVGWYPDGNLDGSFRLVVYEGDFHGTLLHEFVTRDRVALVQEIERLLAIVCEGNL